MSHKAPSQPLDINLILSLTLAALAVTLRLVPGVRTIDDAYITYRYARNIAHGVGFVYNPGEYVLGTTTPLYTLLLSLVAWGTRSEAYQLISAIINALADGVGVALLYIMMRRLLGHWLPGLLLGLLWAVAPKSVTFAIGGMETSVYVMLMIASFAAWLSGRTVLTAALAALGTLTRPDALIWAGPLAVAMVVEAWKSHPERPLVCRLPWLELGTYLIILSPWLTYSTLTFGSPLTNSIAAKAVAYRLGAYQALSTLVQHYAIPFFENMTFGPPGVMIGMVLYPLLAALGGLFLIHRDWRTAPLVFFPWLHFIVFAISNPLIFRWYLAPPMPFYFLCIIMGVWGLAERITDTRWQQWVMLVAGMAWVIFSLRAWVLHPDHGPDRPAPEMAWHRLELLYEQAGRDLAPYVDENTVIAAGDIGAVGWYSSARILDTLGLISPRSTTYYPIDPSMLATTGYAVAPDLIFDELPDYIVILETYGRNGLLKDPRFEDFYRLREVIDTDIYQSEGMLIYERVD